MPANISAGANISALSLIIQTDFVGKVILFILLCASIISWAIIIKKYISFSKAEAQIIYIMQMFGRCKDIQTLFTAAKEHKSPLTDILTSGVMEAKRTRQASGSNNQSALESAKYRIFMSMSVAQNVHCQRMESGLSVLATISSSAPFIGLLGTVWGIMHSFQSIAVSKNTSLAVVAPGIAEALLATAVGLFAAIPAGIFFNLLTARCERMSGQMENFAKEITVCIARSMEEDGY